jgi:hypothetical protein
MLVAIKYTSIKPHVSDAPFLKNYANNSRALEIVILSSITLLPQKSRLNRSFLRLIGSVYPVPKATLRAQLAETCADFIH